jgi:hypothetical protein
MGTRANDIASLIRTGNTITAEKLNVGQLGGRRNLIINGAMQVAQRGAQETGVTSDGYYTVDRVRLSNTSLGTWTIDQSTDAPNGFSNSFKLTCTTADPSPAASDKILVISRIEAQDLQSLGYGTSDAQSLTLSFYVKSNKTGNGSLNLLQNDNSNKMVSFQYSILSADTWERKTISIPADTSGLINNDNGYGLQLEWFLNGGSNFTGGSHNTSWAVFSNTNRNVSNLGVGEAVSDYFAITGVQLEVGDTATPFEHRSYGEELALCQRYYEEGSYLFAGDVTSGVTYYNEVHFKVTKRASPSTSPSPISTTGGLGFVTGQQVVNAINQNRIQISEVCDSTVNGGYFLGTYAADAEL